MARACAALLFALTLPSFRLHAQQVVYAAGLSDLDSTTQAALGREITRARDRGLPVEPLVAKVREGRLKRAPALRIRAAVERLSERLSVARDALGVNSTAEEVTAGADAIAAGAQAASLRAVRAATPQSVTAPIGALAQLLASGVSEGKAVEMVLGLLRRNASPALLVALGNQVEADVASGLSPNASATFRLRALERQLNVATAAEAANGGFVNLGAGSVTNGTPNPPPRRKP
ncbi:MAG: hypothetical protein M3Z05_15870 [Gemmatimonadota bacterium]|nr:hypothetical protein [Gemmatimonadota bacterium]